MRLQKAADAETACRCESAVAAAALLYERTARAGAPFFQTTEINIKDCTNVTSDKYSQHFRRATSAGLEQAGELARINADGLRHALNGCHVDTFQFHIPTVWAALRT
jgi:hypothetical protein